VKEESNILLTTKRSKANWFADILRRNYLSQHVIEEEITGKIGVTGRRRRGRKLSLHVFKETRRYRKLKEKALDLSVWRTP
jgi:hypothetical protein